MADSAPASRLPSPRAASGSARPRSSSAPGAGNATVRFELPLELRNQVTRVEIAGERSAGAVHLLDARSRWHRIGLVSGESREQAQPLLAPLYYIEKALAPFAELVRPKDANLAASVAEAFKQKASVLVMADIGTLSGDLMERVDDWVKKGGVLVRFAGPRLEKGGDDLSPSACGWAGARWAAHCRGRRRSRSPPSTSSLFAGLAIPPDVVINRQVLADPARLTQDVQDLGAPQGRHAARHRRPARRGPGRPLPRHRELRLVQPAHVGPVRGDAAAHLDARPQRRRCRRRRRDDRHGRPTPA